MEIIKTEEGVKIKPDKEGSIDNQLEFSKFLSEVQGRVKGQLTSDFVLAKLSEKDKEATREILANAYYSKRVMETVIIKAAEQTWEYDKERLIWRTRGLEEKRIKEIREQIELLMDTMTVRLQVTAVVNRNVPNNKLLRMLLRRNEEEEGEEEKEKNAEKVAGKVMEVIKREGE